MRKWVGSVLNKRQERRAAKAEMDFLPAALAIQSKPPSPAGRVFAWTIVIMVTTALVWFANARIDVVAVAHGKIIPGDRIKVVQPYQKGVVKDLLVENGDSVKIGQPLIILDSVITESDVQSIQQRIASTSAAIERYRSFIARVQSPDALRADIFPVNSTESLQASLLEAELQNFRSNIGMLQRTLVARKAELEGVRADIERLNTIIPFTEERASAVKTMLGKDLASRQDYLTLEEQRINQRQELAKQQARVGEIQATIEEIEQRIIVFKSDAEQKALRELDRLTQEYATLTEELQKAAALNEKQVIKSPVNGVVQELAIHTVGGIVTAAQPLMKIVPQGTRLEVEAMLANKDIGFVFRGQPAEIKVSAFPFTEYGVIHADVVGLSDAAIPDEKAGWLFKMRLEMERETIGVNGKDVRLRPGMEVIAEVKTGTRSMMDYFLSPIMKSVDESLQER
ncbi:HlyD family type I secretion periplasmic adaptor subunit [Marinobacter persicus]|uniref:Membrane fusion protein (MFP) family protein n=1 Tax=Marinobacter persicus TaxID=930118 RepID=A0A2S6G2G1_9GAMM|nr:HlyD family type I secretion periplasmic adaptor subunit [Marinobacter persicus]PPK49865.1 hemolysin D [Marinobacter persicus]PPK51301.1 hemolysin D [Marinobacter persicus]PPK55798.1 hemolysin D [Marinobacter persicus]